MLVLSELTKTKQIADVDNVACFMRKSPLALLTNVDLLVTRFHFHIFNMTIEIAEKRSTDLMKKNAINFCEKMPIADLVEGPFDAVLCESRLVHPQLEDALVLAVLDPATKLATLRWRFVGILARNSAPKPTRDAV